MAWEKRRKVELERVGRKCIGHWMNGIEKKDEKSRKEECPERQKNIEENRE